MLRTIVNSRLVKELLFVIFCAYLTILIMLPLLWNSKTQRLIVSTDHPTLRVNSIEQLTDTNPDDWAFQALQSALERYGVVDIYSDKTYRGDSAATRYEIAAFLNNSLNEIDKLTSGGLANSATREDLLALQRSSDEFLALLRKIQSRVDNMEASVDKINNLNKPN